MSNILNLKGVKLFAIVVLAAAILATFGMVAVQTAGAADCSITSTLRVGSRGDQVKCLQVAVGVTADGKFGPITKAAVQTWQTSKSLVADGIFGPKSNAALVTAGGGAVSGLPAGCTSTAGYSSTTGTKCDSSAGVVTTLPAGCSSTAGFSSTTGQSCSGAVTVVPTTGSVSVSLASDNPASGTLIIDNTTGVMQSAAPIAKFVFSNGTGSEVKVNTVKLTRTGIAADGDIDNLYLYEGTTKLVEMSSVSTKVFSFNSSAGLFTIPANGSKAIWVGVSMAVATSGPTSVGFSINSASDVVLSNATTVGGSFPIKGNEFLTAFITDLGYINLTSTSTFPATLDPKAEAQELWRFTATANSQKMNLNRIILTLVGTTAVGDIQDLELSVGGVKVGATAQLGSDNKATFDWSASPYTLLSGQNKVFVLSGKVVKGTGRAFKFTIRSKADFTSIDTNYGVETAALNAGAALTLVEPETGDGTNVNNGTLTISRSANSPSGNVAGGGLDVPLARFDYRANGEDIKVAYVRVSVNSTIANQATDTLNDGKLYFNGSQVGVTDDSVADATDNVFSLGNTVIIPAGTTGVFEYRANIEQDSGTDLAAEDTIIVSLSAGTAGDATGQTSSTSLTPSASTGQTLTVKTGTLTVTKNASVPDATTTNTSGVLGATNVKVGSMVIVAGAGEAVNITQIVVGDDPDTATSDFGVNFQNLTLRNGSATSTPLATTQGTLSTTEGVNYTFSVSPSITVAAGAQYVVDLYADILTRDGTVASGNYNAAEIGLEFVSVSATGVNTSADASYSTVVNLHNVVLATSGSLTVTQNAGTPVAGQLVMGETGQTLAILDFAAGSAEDVNVSVLILTDTSSFAGSLSNVKLYAQGITDPIGTVSSFSAQANGTATFNLAADWRIPRNETKTLTVKADVNAYGSGVSGGSHTVNIADNSAVTTRGASGGVAITETVASAPGGTAQNVYRTRAVASLASTSPGGSSTVGAGKSVFEFTVTANSAYATVVNTVVVTMSGSANMTSTGNAILYKSTDLNTALATEAYVTDTATSGTTTTFVNSAGCDSGIPFGANVRIYDDTLSAYAVASGGYEITGISSTGGCTMTFTPAVAATNDVDVSDVMYYRPLQPGTGELYFGAQTTLTADVANNATSLAVTSTKGFSVGDTVALTGFTSTGVATSVASGCVVTFIASATALTTTACVLSPTTGLSFDWLSGASNTANAIATYHNSAAMATTGLINTSGQEIAAGSSVTFVVKGDTTSQGTAAANLGVATTSSTLQASLAAVGDLNWDDKVSYGITTVTKNLPINGNTLTFAY